MKKLLFTLIFFIFNFNFFAQEPIVDSAKKWNVLTGWYTQGEQFDEYLQVTDVTRISDNIVVINGNNYHPIINNNQILTDKFIRETDNNVVYLFEDGAEYLLYDFNVEIGDVLSLYNHYSGFFDWTVVNVETVFYANQNRIKIDLDYYGNIETWYEGIGSLKGLTNSADMTIDIDKQLLCFYNNDELLYSDGVCNISTNPIQDVSFFNENNFVLDHFLIDENVIEYPNGEFDNSFVVEQGNTNNELNINLGGLCGNSTSTNVLVNTDRTLNIQSRGGTTLMTCNPLDYPNGNNQEQRFFNILTGNIYLQTVNPSLVYYEISDDETQLTIWTDSNEKLIFNVSIRLEIGDYFKKAFRFFPNPVKENLTIQTSSINYKVNIYNVLGSEVVSKQGLFNNSNINMLHLSNGVYFLKISNNQSSFTSKIMKE